MPFPAAGKLSAKSREAFPTAGRLSSEFRKTSPAAGDHRKNFFLRSASDVDHLGRFRQPFPAAGKPFLKSRETSPAAGKDVRKSQERPPTTGIVVRRFPEVLPAAGNGPPGFSKGVPGRRERVFQNRPRRSRPPGTTSAVLDAKPVAHSAGLPAGDPGLGGSSARKRGLPCFNCRSPPRPPRGRR